MLTFEQITELIELVARHGLEGVEIERSGFRFKIEGHRKDVAVAPAAPAFAPPAPVAAVPPAAAVTAPAAAPPAPNPEPAPEPEEDLHEVTSPIVGTFYRAPSPESPSFVEVGDRVEKGQVLCIVEAMKLMNEIESDIAGEIVEIRPKNAQAVEFGEPLFVIRPA